MFGIKALTARLDEAEARVRGLVKLAGDQVEVNAKLAGAIDEIERRQNNSMHATNAVYSALTRRIETLAVETVQALQAITKASATARDGEAPADLHPPAVADVPLDDAVVAQLEQGAVAARVANGRVLVDG